MSVVIPARDDAAELAVCLRALARQTRPPLEVIVVDNASTDDTAAVAAAHGARVLREPRVGIAHAAATGYDAAVGDVVARLDADSRPVADWVERVATILGEQDDVDVVTGTGAFHDLRGVAGRAAAAVYLGAYHLLGHLGAGGPMVWGSSMAMRRQTWSRARDRVHPDPGVHDDMDLAMVLAGEWVVRRDRWLVADVSARSLRGRAQLVRRFRRACRTLRLNWAEVPPWRRWARRLGRVGGPVVSPHAPRVRRGRPRRRTAGAPRVR